MQANGRTRRLFGRLKLFPGWQHRGESAVYDCLVRVGDGVRGWRSVRVGLLSTKLAFLGRVYSQVRVRVTLVSGARELSSMMIFQRQMSGRGKVSWGEGKCPTFASPTHVEPRTGSRRTQRTSAVHYGVISDAPKSLSK